MAIDFSQISGVSLGQNEISRIAIGSNEIWSQEIPYEEKGDLDFNSPSPFTLKLGCPGISGSVEYSMNRNTWNNYSNLNLLTAAKGAYNRYHIYMRGNGNSKYGGFIIDGNNVRCDGKLKSLYNRLYDYFNLAASGAESLFLNCTALTHAPSIDVDDISSMGDYALSNTFMGCTNLIDASNIYLKEFFGNQKYGYATMFRGCTKLKIPPRIPFWSPMPENTEGTYNSMFKGCTSLLLDKIPNFDFSMVGSAPYRHKFSEMFFDTGIKCSEVQTPGSVAWSLGPQCDNKDAMFNADGVSFIPQKGHTYYLSR